MNALSFIQINGLLNGLTLSVSHLVSTHRDNWEFFSCHSHHNNTHNACSLSFFSSSKGAFHKDQTGLDQILYYSVKATSLFFLFSFHHLEAF